MTILGHGVFTPFDARKFRVIFIFMKNRKKKHLTFGELIAAAYRAWGEAEAGEKLRLAVQTRLVIFQGQK